MAGFTIPGTNGQSAQVAVTPLPGMAGKENLIVNMWRQQVGLAELSEDEAGKQLTTVDIGGERGKMFDMAGKSAAGLQILWRGLPLVTEMSSRDVPSGIVELLGPQGESRPILVSGHFAQSQTLTVGGKACQLVLRPERYYKPYRLHLIDFRFDRYPGMEIPKNFSSRVRVERPDTKESREVTIRMNEPLRYGGKTFFQASWDQADEKGTVLQVVDNPSWLTPYWIPTSGSQRTLLS